jgi:hypothetical protein
MLGLVTDIELPAVGLGFADQGAKGDYHVARPAETGFLENNKPPLPIRSPGSNLLYADQRNPT